MPSISKNNERIAKNSIMLYFRMILLMIISLYTSRVVLEELGVNDFGIYQVVSGIIVFFSFLSASLSSSTQRFLNYEMGKSNEKEVRKIFTNSILLHIAIACIIIFLGETLGLYFLNNKLVIPETRNYAANCVFQFSIFTFAIGIIGVPLNATIIAHEKMSAFAYISIIEAILKLMIAFILIFIDCDKLILYAALMFIVGFTIQLIYWFYCCKNFSECSLDIHLICRKRITDLASFSGWSLLGGVRSVCHTQGITILTNMFFGVIVNAAQGITNQVTLVVNSFVNNFLIALNPQIIQLYASGKKGELHRLVLRGCRISIFLVAIITVPLLLETELVLKTWLKNVPEQTEIFVRIALIAVLIQPNAIVLQTANAATGDVKKYHIVLAVIAFLHLPLTYYAFYLGFPPYTSMIIYVILVFFIQIARIIFACNAIEMNISTFIKEIFKSNALVIISAIPATIIHYYLEKGFFSAVIVSGVYVAIGVYIFFSFGFSKNEKEKMLEMIRLKRNNKENTTNLFKEDKRFFIDARNIARLTDKKIKKYEIKNIKLGYILRDLSYRKKGIVNLCDTLVYSYLSNKTNGLQKYQEYCRICNMYAGFSLRSKESFDKLIENLSLNEYSINQGAICIDNNNLILEGQHRACILLNKHGPNYVIPVVKITYTEKKRIFFAMKVLFAKFRNLIYMYKNRNK